MIITVISFKGGVGKSTISQNLAVAFAHEGTDVCILDADNNGSTSMWHSVRMDNLPAVDVFHVSENGDVVKSINALAKKYELVIVDCPPAIERTTSYAVAKADLSIIPVSTTGGSDIWATEKFLEHLQLLRAKLDIDAPILFVPNRFESNVRMHQAYIDALKAYAEKYDVSLVETRIAKRTAYGEANTSGCGVVEWDNQKAKDEILSLKGEVYNIISKISNK